MFDHEKFDNYSFYDIPLDRDIYAVDEIYIHDYETAMLRFFEGDPHEYVGYVSRVSARAIKSNSLQLSWYPNVLDRFHEVSITLPRDQFVACVGSRQHDEKPRIFVRSSWINSVYLRTYSIFALIDAADVKLALENGNITRSGLIQLRDRIDALAAEHIDVSFISFADSILLKSNWSVGNTLSESKYEYKPEVFIRLADTINGIYQDVLGLNTYAIITQGSNEYYEDPLLHISETRNHISLNSLGSPFAQLIDIEKAAREGVKLNFHPRSELYMDEQYYRSLAFEFGFNKNEKPNRSYHTSLVDTPLKYFYSTRKDILEHLKNDNEEE